MPKAIYHQAPGHDIPVELTWRIVPENRAEKRRASEAFDLVDDWGDVLVSDVKEGEKPGQFSATEAAKAEAKAKGQASSNSGSNSSEVERIAAENAALKAESEAQRAAAVRARSEGLAEVQQLKADLEAAKAAAAKASPAAAAAQKPVK